MHHLPQGCVGALQHARVFSVQVQTMLQKKRPFCQYSAGQTQSRLTWLARMSYSISPPVMSKPINSTFLVFVSSLAMGLHDMSNSFHQYSFARPPKGLITLMPKGCASLPCWHARGFLSISVSAAGSTLKLRAKVVAQPRCPQTSAIWPTLAQSHSSRSAACRYTASHL